MRERVSALKLLVLSVALFSSGIGVAQAEPIVLKTLAYNVWGAPFSGKNAKRRMPKIAAKIREMQADIVAFSEAFEGCFVAAGARTLIRKAGYRFSERGPLARGAKCVSSGLLILSKFPIVASADLAFRSCTGTDCLARKGVAFARVQVPDLGEVDVYATHTDAGRKGIAARERQFAQAADFVRRHSGGGNRLTLFMGDLNATPDSREFLRFQADLDMRDSYSEYVSTHDVDDVTRDGFTSDPVRNPILAARGQTERNRLDYILFRESIPAIGRVSVGRARLTFDESVDRGKPLSDHFGVATDFTIERR